MTPDVRARRARRLAALVGLVLLLLVPSPAGAHAVLVGTDPKDGQVVATAPETISVTFNERVTLAPTGTQLLDATGAPVEAEVTALDEVVTFTPAAVLADGTYIVSWRVVSADSHPVAGGISFSVGAPSEDVVDVPTAEPDRHVDVAKILAEIVRYTGVLLLVGLVVFGRFVAGPTRDRSPTFAARLRRAERWSASLAVAGAVLLVPLVKLWQDGEPLRRFVAPALWRDALTDPPAAAAALVVVGIGVAALADRRRMLPGVAVGLALVAGSLVVVGHTRAFGPGWLVLAADLVHVATAALWVGGVVGLCLLLARDPQARAGETVAAVGRFSALALGLVAALGVAAVVLYWRIAGSLDGLWSTAYGRLVLVKVGLAAGVVAVAAYTRFVLVRRLQANDQRPHHLAVLRRTVAWEAVLLLVAVGATGMLVTQTPPVTTEAAPAAANQTLRADLGDVEAVMVVTPGARGTNSLELRLTDADGEPFEPYETPELSVSLPSYELGPFKHPLSETGPGRYEATVDFTLEGRWTVTLGVRTSEFENPVVSERIRIR